MFASAPPSVDAELLQLSASVAPDVRLVEVLRALDAAGVDAVDVNRRSATLDDVFLALTAEVAA